MIQNSINYIVISIIMLSLSCQGSVFEEKIPEILGVENLKFTLIESFDDFGGFGEGYTFELFEISKEGINAFIGNSIKGLPEIKSNSNWKKINWTKSLEDSLHIEVWTKCLNYTNKNDKLQKFLSDIKSSLKKEKTYYAYYYRPDLENPQDVQLYIIDVSEMKLYVIESKI